MTKKLESQLAAYIKQLKVLRAFNSAQALLSWDREAIMPAGASLDRGETISVLAGFAHNLATDSKFVKLVDELVAQKSALSSIEVRSVTETQRDLKKSVLLPTKFVEETNEIMNFSYAAWLKAKHADDFSLFAEHLEKVFANRKAYALLLDAKAHPYDVLLDDYEEGLTIAQLQPMFAELKQALKELLPEVLARRKAVSNPLNGIHLDHIKLENFLRAMAKQIGFDELRGAFGHVEHPFEIGISPNDNRINTHFDDTENSFTIMGLIHELGHGLYEQNGDPQYIPLGLDGGVSLGIHESQSRFLENVIGRSLPFWTYFLPKLQMDFPEFKSITAQQIVTALNMVKPSLIRTEADEVTYNLHIILRFELEIEIMTGRLAVKDVGAAWKAKMAELLGVEPTSDADGVLQDVHWAWGSIGYFPTYTLGNMNAAQLFASFAKAHPNWEAEVSVGNFSSYFNWFKEHVWKHASRYTPAEIMIKATGENINPKFLIEYLRKKYLA